MAIVLSVAWFVAVSPPASLGVLFLSWHSSAAFPKNSVRF